MPSAAPIERPFGLKGWIGWFSLLLFLCLVAYLPALHGAFIWDDTGLYIVENDLLKEADGWWKFWLTTEPRDYYPLAYTTFWLEWRVFGMNPFGYHVVNVVLHAFFATGLIWALRMWRIPGAAMAGVLFALHPVAVESVAWISQRKTLLGGGFAFLAMGCFGVFLRHGRLRSYWLTLLCFFLSLSGKPVAISLPVVMLGAVLIVEGRLSLRRMTQTIPFFGLSVLFGVVGVWFQQHNIMNQDVVRSDDVITRLLTVGWTLWFYLYKVILPANLCFVYPRWVVDSRSILAWIPAIAWALLPVLALSVGRIRGKWMLGSLAAYGWFTLMVLPSSGIVDVYYWRYSFVGDHYQYQALPAVLAFVAASASAMSSRAGKGAAAAVASLGALTAVVFGAATCYYARDYFDSEILWGRTAARNPNAWVAHINVAAACMERGDLRSADIHSAEAVRLHPDFPESQITRGSIEARLGRHEKSVEHYREAVRLAPTRVDARHSLGVELARIRKYDEAITALEESHSRALRSPKRPVSVLSLNELALTLAKADRLDDSLARFAESLKLRPDNSQAHLGRGMALDWANRNAEAVAAYRAAMAGEPPLMSACLPLARLQDRAGDHEGALQSLKAGYASQPDWPENAWALSWVLAASREGRIRDPKSALSISQSFLAAAVGDEAATGFETLAVALAANGRWDEAVAANARALAACKASDSEKLRAAGSAIERRGQLFKERKPYVGPLSEQPVPPSADPRS